MRTGKRMAAAVVAGVFAARGLVAATEEYTAEGLPFARKGIPNAEIVFAAGRTAANLAAHGGLSEVRYFGAQGIGEAKLFSGSPISVFNQVFRPYASFGGGWTVRDLKIGKGTLDIDFTGHGPAVAALTLDGQPLEGASVPMSRLAAGHHLLTVTVSGK